MGLLKCGRFWERVHSGEPTLCDGALGSELIRQGVPSALTVDANLDFPVNVDALYQGYIAAGAQIISTNTFGLAEGQNWEEGVLGGVSIAMRAARENASEIGVWLSLSSDSLRKRLKWLAAASRDVLDWPEMLLIETCSSLLGVRQAVADAASIRHNVLVVTAHFGADGRMLDGTSPEEFASTLVRHGVHVIGANCGHEPEQFIEVVDRMRSTTTTPLLIQPSAGLPALSPAGQWEYPVDPGRFASVMRKIAEHGANFIGGCCGTSCVHISAVRDQLASFDLH